MRAERVEGPVESSLFTLVDELTRRFKVEDRPGWRGARPAIGPRPTPVLAEAGLDRGVTDDHHVLASRPIATMRKGSTSTNAGCPHKPRRCSRKRSRSIRTSRWPRPSSRSSTTIWACSTGATRYAKRALDLTDRLTRANAITSRGSTTGCDRKHRAEASRPTSRASSFIPSTRRRGTILVCTS